MPNFNRNLYPPDGYIFKDKDGVVHRGSNFGELFRKISAYRMRNRIPAGDPQAEVNAQLCKLFPGYCKSEGSERPKPRRTGCKTCGKPPKRR